MAFTVETGTGSSTANAYVSVADADTYNVDHEMDTDWSKAGDSAKQKAIRLATQYLDLKYRTLWRGRRYNEDQALAWPRTAFYDYDGYTIEAETIPTALKNACTELAIRVIKGDDLFPINENPGLRSKAIHNATTGQTEVYEGGSVGTKAKEYPVVEAMLSDLIHSGPPLERC